MSTVFTPLSVRDLETVPSRPLPRPPPRIVVRAVLALHRFFGRVARRLLPPEVSVFDTATGAARTELLGALCRLGVFDALTSPKTAEVLAAELGLEADRLFRVLRASAQVGALDMGRDLRFRLTRIGRALTRHHPSRARDFALFFSSPANLDAWRRVEATLRTGRNGFEVAHGTDVWSFYEHHPDDRETFARAMMGITLADAPLIASLYPWGEVTRVCDVGGGRGTLLSELLLRHPHLEGVLVDAPGVLASARSLLAHRGVSERIRLTPGDFFTAIPEGADAYLMKNILHDWDDATALAILAVCRRAMRPGQRLVLAEALVEPRDTTSFGVLFDLQMMVSCRDGRERSRADFERLLLASGFSPGRVFASPTTSVIEGIAA